jgi:hypothetical protein
LVLPKVSLGCLGQSSQNRPSLAGNVSVCIAAGWNELETYLLKRFECVSIHSYDSVTKPVPCGHHAVTDRLGQERRRKSSKNRPHPLLLPQSQPSIKWTTGSHPQSTHPQNRRHPPVAPVSALDQMGYWVPPSVEGKSRPNSPLVVRHELVQIEVVPGRASRKSTPSTPPTP